MYALITPARNEAGRLQALATSVLSQTVRPAAWVIVDDGSSDGTPALVAELTRAHPWIMLVPGRRQGGELGDGRREGRALLALAEGMAAAPADAELLFKLDADVTLEPDHCERIVAAFAADPRLGIASGSRHELVDGEWRRINSTDPSVEGPCRAYRRHCWEQIQPLDPHLGWDGIDVARAHVAGWRTQLIRDLGFRHHRYVGERDGRRLRSRAAEGLAAHYMGYRPSYLALRALWHLRSDPYALFMLWGWAEAKVRRRPRCRDAAAVAFIRHHQSARQLAKRYREARGSAIHRKLH